jgi:hypothetical protein
MTESGTSLNATIDLEGLGLDRGAHLLLQRSLSALPEGGRLDVYGRAPALSVHLAAWCRAHGHGFEAAPPDADGRLAGIVVRRNVEAGRWQGAVRAGGAGPEGVLDKPVRDWGLAARGALIEAGGPQPIFDLDEKRAVWTDLAPRLYAQAAASQWDPASIEWDKREDLPPEIEVAVVQVMTYLVENEQAALVVPARFLGRIHPHFREVAQFLATQVADEARHMEVFARRAGLNGSAPGVSTVGGRASLATLLDVPDFSSASFLLSVLGEGTFLNLLSFLERSAPDRVTREITRLARQDETRHVAYAMGHLEYQIEAEMALRERLRAGIEQRYEALRQTAGLADEVYDSLIVLAAGSWEPSAIASGFDAVAALQAEMAEGRERRLLRLGFPPSEAAALSALHTRNFM